MGVSVVNSPGTFIMLQREGRREEKERGKGINLSSDDIFTKLKYEVVKLHA